MVGITRGKAWCGVVAVLAMILIPMGIGAEGQGEKTPMPGGAPNAVLLDMEGLGTHVTVSVPLWNEGVKILVSRIGEAGVKIADTEQGLAIVPIANIQVFRAAKASGNKPVYVEQTEFGKGLFDIAFFLPDPNRVPYFLADKARGHWVRWDNADELKRFGFEVTGVLDAKEKILTLNVTKWPEGDPTLGWGT